LQLLWQIARKLRKQITISTLQNILLLSFYGVIAIQLCYYLGVFSLFCWAKPKPSPEFTKPISVIICAKNEGKNLKRLIPLLFKQDYPNFELVVINDNSSDETLEVIESFLMLYPHIKLVDVKENEQFWGNKKYALTLGIKAASCEYLLFTDADCKPNSTHWISAMASQFNHDKQIVIGYGGYKKSKTFLNKLIRYETLITAIQYFGYAKAGVPYMGVGRNMAYKKNLFFEANGFIKHMKIKSGDDDLFVNQMATKANTAICISQDSFTTSLPKTTFKEWINQKKRHVSTATFYKPFHKFLLGLFYTSQLLFWILSILVLIFAFKPLVILPLIGIRFLIYYLILYASAKKLQEKDLVFLGFFLEIILLLIQLRIFIGNKFSKPTHW